MNAEDYGQKCSTAFLFFLFLKLIISRVDWSLINSKLETQTLPDKISGLSGQQHKGCTTVIWHTACPANFGSKLNVYT